MTLGLRRSKSPTCIQMRMGLVRELGMRCSWNVELPGGHFGSGEVRRAEDEVAVSIGKRQCAVGEFFGLDVAGVRCRMSQYFG
jgi:hypothetical protein